MGDPIDHSKMEGDLETERDWAYLCRAFTVAKDAALEVEKEYTNLPSAPLHCTMPIYVTFSTRQALA